MSADKKYLTPKEELTEEEFADFYVPQVGTAYFNGCYREYYIVLSNEVKNSRILTLCVTPQRGQHPEEYVIKPMLIQWLIGDCALVGITPDTKAKEVLEHFQAIHNLFNNNIGKIWTDGTPFDEYQRNKILRNLHDE